MNIKNGVQFICIDDDEFEQRIDNFLFTKFKNVPKNMIYRIIRKGNIRVNKNRIKPKYKLKKNDIIRIPPIRIKKKIILSSLSDKKNFLKKSILYEDESILAINKPSGIAVHGGSGLSFGVIEGLRAIFKKHHFLELVHRLDRDTSGILLIAKKRSVLKILHEQLRSNKIRKEYIALVHGKWSSKIKSIQIPLIKNISINNKKIIKVNKKGKFSETHFEIKEYFDNVTLIKAIPLTGRTHQIRVHTMYAKHPIVFDVLYGNKKLDEQLNNIVLKRLFLHASTLDFIHPKSGKKIQLHAPLNAELINYLKKIRNYKNNYNL
ncbi:23S rRNA pseudouridine(955/2504/2580) synthase RluC [Candidatus Providencia siddallii]|uniref:Pseudouridine synthase n=1 Tax=Candidatus Providencia siddallii TaxID=1715285 RepID=A0ABM9NP67_9GAMM